MLGLEAFTGSLDDFGFEDYLNGTDMAYFSFNIAAQLNNLLKLSCIKMIK